jgi:hypothetical protein
MTFYTWFFRLFFVKNARQCTALAALFASNRHKTPAHLFAKPPTEVHNARQCPTLSPLLASLRHKTTAHFFANHLPLIIVLFSCSF